MSEANSFTNRTTGNKIDLVDTEARADVEELKEEVTELNETLTELKASAVTYARITSTDEYTAAIRNMNNYEFITMYMDGSVVSALTNGDSSSSGKCIGCKVDSSVFDSIMLTGAGANSYILRTQFESVTSTTILKFSLTQL